MSASASASTKDVAGPWDGGLLRRPTNHARRGHPRQCLGRENGASTELLGAHDASCGSRNSVGGSRKSISRWWSVPTACWALLALSAITAFVLLRQLIPAGASIPASEAARGGRDRRHYEGRVRDRGGRNVGGERHHRTSFSADNSKAAHDTDSLDAAALSEVVIIGGYHNKDEEFREGRPDGGYGFGVGVGQEAKADGGGWGGNAIPSPGAAALAAAARGGGGDLEGLGDLAVGVRVGWGDKSNDRGVLTGPAVPASAPPGWGRGDVGAGDWAGAGGVAGAKSVILGIPTVPRPQGVNYLEQTLHAVLAQVQQEDPNTPSSERVAMSILVMNVHGPGHDAFYQARERHDGNPGIAFVTVGEVADVEGNPIEVGEGDPLDAKSRAMKKTLPLTKVRKQTRDLVHLLRAAAGRAEHYLFMEDDMLLCEGGAAAIGRMLNKAHSYHPDWIAIRASFGMNGIFIQDRDVLLFADYLERHQKRRPPDHLVVEWFAGETPASAAFKGSRQHMAFRYNVFEHLGSVSTLRGKASPAYPTCFEELTIETLFEVEAFDGRGCPDEDMSPCDVPAGVKTGFPQIHWQDLYFGKS